MKLPATCIRWAQAAIVVGIHDDRNGWSRQSGELAFNQVAEDTRGLHEFVEGAAFHNPAGFHDIDAVGLFEG